MHKEINVEFEENKKVTAVFGDLKVPTDLPQELGGDHSAPTPVELFLTSLATCAGHYARNFCESRAISIEGMSLNMTYDMDQESRGIKKINYTLTLPDGFPEKYKAAMLRAVDLCTVKKQLISPPAFELELV